MQKLIFHMEQPHLLNTKIIQMKIFKNPDKQWDLFIFSSLESFNKLLLDKSQDHMHWSEFHFD